METSGRNQSGFEEVFRNQSIRRVRLPSVRGRIYDTNEECLADSIPSYCIAIYTAELRTRRSTMSNTLELMHEIQQRIGRKPDVNYEEIKRHIALTPHQPLEAWKKLTTEEASKANRTIKAWAESTQGSALLRRLPGIDPEQPVQDNTIAIRVNKLEDRPTSTTANTLELIYEISDRIGIPREITLQDIKKPHLCPPSPAPAGVAKYLARNHGQMGGFLL